MLIFTKLQATVIDPADVDGLKSALDENNVSSKAFFLPLNLSTFIFPVNNTTSVSK